MSTGTAYGNHKIPPLKTHALPIFIYGFLPLLFPVSITSAQAIRTFACPDGSLSYRCIDSNETCGWRNERPTAAELEEAKRSAERNAVSIMAPCPTLPSGIRMELCWIDRNYYCKAPSPADIARAEQAKREREEKARQEKLAAERKQAEIARETARLGAHREAEARRLVEMREAAAKARGGKGAKNAPPPEAAGDARKVCTNSPLRTALRSRFKGTEVEARADLARDATNLCRMNTGSPTYSIGPVSCVREDRSVWALMPIGKRPASHPPIFEFNCSAPIVCAAPKETCRTEGTVRSSGQ